MIVTQNNAASVKTMSATGTPIRSTHASRNRITAAAYAR